MINEREIRSHIVEVGRRIYEHGYVAASDGNISARLPDGTVVTTPTMICKGRMKESDLVLVDVDGNKLRKEERSPSAASTCATAVASNAPSDTPASKAAAASARVRAGRWG